MKTLIAAVIFALALIAAPTLAQSAPTYDAVTVGDAGSEGF